jgi:hypothetical protein
LCQNNQISHFSLFYPSISPLSHDSKISLHLIFRISFSLFYQNNQISLPSFTKIPFPQIFRYSRSHNISLPPSIFSPNKWVFSPNIFVTHPQYHFPSISLWLILNLTSILNLTLSRWSLTVNLILLLPSYPITLNCRTSITNPVFISPSSIILNRRTSFNFLRRFDLSISIKPFKLLNQTHRGTCVMGFVGTWIGGTWTECGNFVA